MSACTFPSAENMWKITFKSAVQKQNSPSNLKRGEKKTGFPALKFSHYGNVLCTVSPRGISLLQYRMKSLSMDAMHVDSYYKTKPE